jgi:hypothetical protein
MFTAGPSRLVPDCHRFPAAPSAGMVQCWVTRRTDEPRSGHRVRRLTSGAGSNQLLQAADHETDLLGYPNVDLEQLDWARLHPAGFTWERGALRQQMRVEIPGAGGVRTGPAPRFAVKVWPGARSESQVEKRTASRGRWPLSWCRGGGDAPLGLSVPTGERKGPPSR